MKYKSTCLYKIWNWHLPFPRFKLTWNWDSDETDDEDVEAEDDDVGGGDEKDLGPEVEFFDLKWMKNELKWIECQMNERKMNENELNVKWMKIKLDNKEWMIMYDKL